MPRKVPQASVLTTYPSYLGELVELGLAAGYEPADFGLRWVSGGRRRSVFLLPWCTQFSP